MTWRQFSGTPASNASGSTGVNWAEGQAPSTVNDSARQMMADIFLGLASISANVASATTTDLSTATGHYVPITGSVTITALGTEVAGIGYCVYFVAAPLLTHNGTSLILPGAANIQAAAGDTAYFVSLGSGNWRCTMYQKASGAAVSGTLAAASMATQADQETASSVVLAVSPGRQQYHPSAAKAWIFWTIAGAIEASYGISSLTDNGVGDFTLVFSVTFTSAAYASVITVADRNPPVIVGYDANLASGIGVKSRDVTGALADSAGHYSAVFYGDQ